MAPEHLSQPDWSDLPTCLLTCIAECLPSRTDVVRFRSVCRDFRSAIAPLLEPRYPYPNLKIPATILSHRESGHLILGQSSFYAVEPLTEVCETRVLRVEEMEYGVVSLKKPCGEGKYNKMTKELLDLLDYRVKLMANIHQLYFAPEKVSIYDTKLKCRKVVVSDDGSAIMARTSDGDFRRGKLVIWRYGDEDWTQIDMGYNDDHNPECYEEIVYHKERFYAVNYKYRLISVDPKTLVVTEIGFCEVETCSASHRRNYLVKSCNDLFLVVKFYGSNTVRFSVLKIDEEKEDLVEVAPDAFADRVVFVGEGFSFSVPAMEFPGLRMNCIYFSHTRKFYVSGVFDLEESSAFPLEEDDFFRPPTTWLMLNDR